MKRYRVLTANDVYQRDASGTIAACPVGSVIERPDGPVTDRMVESGFIELVHVAVVTGESKRRPTDG